jgi:hypothetical protein
MLLAHFLTEEIHTALCFTVFAVTLDSCLEVQIFTCSVTIPERDHWGDPDVDGRIILRGIFRKWEGVVGTGWSGLRIRTGGGHL